MAIATSVRSVGVSLVIAKRSFPSTAALTATLAVGLFQTILLALLALSWGWLTIVKLRLGKGTIQCANSSQPFAPAGRLSV
jgi:hypothetical protein